MAGGMEPTSEELTAFRTVSDVLAWVPLGGQAKDAALEKLGLEEDDPPRILAALNETVIEDAKETTRVTSGGVQVGLTAAQKAKVGIAWQTSRLKCKLTKSQSQLEQEQKDAWPSRWRR